MTQDSPEQFFEENGRTIAVAPNGHDTANNVRSIPLLIDPIAWQDKPIPERQWIVAGKIPAHAPTLLSGNGGDGKSTLALMLGAARAGRTNWISEPTTPGRTIYLSAEDDESEIRRRLAPIVDHYQIGLRELSERFRLVDLVGQDALLAAPDRDAARPTQLFSDLVDAIKDFGADLVIVDALADAFGGQENDRSQVRQFISMLKGPGRKLGCAWLLLQHPSLTGMNAGTGTSGSTAWRNSVRAQLYLEPAKAGDGQVADPDVRTLTTRKTNYGRPGSSVALRWQDGVFIPQASGSWLDRRALENGADEVFLKLVAQFQRQGLNASPNPGPAYAPKRFASLDDAKGIAKEHLAQAMQRLLKAGRIKTETAGNGSHKRTWLIISDENP